MDAEGGIYNVALVYDDPFLAVSSKKTTSNAGFPESECCIWTVASASCTALFSRHLSNVFLNSFGSNSLRETKGKVMVTGAIYVTKETCKKGVKANEWLWEWTGPFSE